jgi:hypothetical protein
MEIFVFCGISHESICHLFVTYCEFAFHVFKIVGGSGGKLPCQQIWIVWFLFSPLLLVIVGLEMVEAWFSMQRF